MNFKKIKAITLVELLIYIALSIIVSLILLQATNLILNKKNINDEIKENVESIEARKASALLSQYVKKPITAIPPFINLPPSPPNTEPDISIPIVNPWNEIGRIDFSDFPFQYCTCVQCAIFKMRGSDGDGSPRYSTSKKNIGIAETCHAISPGDLPPIPEKSAYVLQSCPPGVTESFELSVDEMMGDIPGDASPSEAIDILRQRMEDLGCYGNILGEGGGVNTQLCNWIQGKIQEILETGKVIKEPCSICYEVTVIWYPFPDLPGLPDPFDDRGGDGVLNNSNSPIDNFNRFAWSSNIGWIDFSQTSVNSNSFDLNGFATVVSNNSKISLNCENTNTCKNSDYKVNINENGVLHGHAWGGDTLGWISFNCHEGGQDGEDICDTSLYGVYIEPQTAKLNGYAWSENIGWISFDCSTGGTDMSNVCDTSDYGVQMSYLKTGYVGIGVVEGSYTIPLEGYNQYDIDSVSNTTATNDGVFTLTSISGSNFMTGALVYLYNKDYGNVYSINTPTYNSNEMISNIQFDLDGKPTGYYSTIFVNPNGDYGILNNAINVTSN